jgi:transcriptional regulator with XRE-family HTH domain
VRTRKGIRPMNGKQNHSSNHGQRNAGNGSRKIGPVIGNRPRILPLKFAKHPRHGVDVRMSPDIHKMICELREARSMTRPQLARRSGIARAHLWGIETGKYVPGIAILERISDALGVGPGRFFKSDVEFLLEHSLVRCVRRLLPHLNSDDRRMILKVLNAAPKKKSSASLHHSLV